MRASAHAAMWMRTEMAKWAKAVRDAQIALQ
jgi:hypothetical protein